MTPNGKMELRFEEGVAVLAFNDPAVLNAIGFRMREDFTAALDRIEASGARCILLTGNGRAFCSGTNLNDPDRPPRDRDAEARGEQKSDLEGWYNPTMERLRALPVPVVSAVNGVAAGIGMSFALSADIRVAARSSYFLQAFARIGLVPDGGATWTEVGANIPGGTNGYYVSRVEASHFDAATAYASVDGHKSDDLRPYVYVTRDYGES